MLRVGDLGEKHRRADLGQRVAETKQRTSAHEGTEVLASSLKDSTDNHDDAANRDGDLATKVVGEDGAVRAESAADCTRLAQLTADYADLHKRDGAQATNLVERTEETKHGTRRLAEEVLPRVEVLDTVEEHAVDPRKGNVSKLKPYNTSPKSFGTHPS
jgi:hypothetical protein